MPERIGPAAGHNSALGSRLSALGSRLSALGSRLSALGSRLSALGSRLSALGSRLSALGSRLSALGSRLSALGSRLSALGKHHVPPSARRGGVAEDRVRGHRHPCRRRARAFRPVGHADLDVTEVHSPTLRGGERKVYGTLAGTGYPGTSPCKSSHMGGVRSSPGVPMTAAEEGWNRLHPRRVDTRAPSRVDHRHQRRHAAPPKPVSRSPAGLTCSPKRDRPGDRWIDIESADSAWRIRTDRRPPRVEAAAVVGAHADRPLDCRMGPSPPARGQAGGRPVERVPVPPPSVELMACHQPGRALAHRCVRPQGSRLQPVAPHGRSRLNRRRSIPAWRLNRFVLSGTGPCTRLRPRCPREGRAVGRARSALSWRDFHSASPCRIVLRREEIDGFSARPSQGPCCRVPGPRPRP